MKKKILIVDDDLDLMDSLRIAIEASGMEVITKNTEYDVVDFVLEKKPDIILLDVVFPENSTAGFEMCRELKQDPRTKHFPIIVLSAINQKFNMAFSASMNKDISPIPADRFLEKPVNPELLLKQIKELL